MDCKFCYWHEGRDKDSTAEKYCKACVFSHKIMFSPISYERYELEHENPSQEEWEIGMEDWQDTLRALAKVGVLPEEPVGHRYTPSEEIAYEDGFSVGRETGLRDVLFQLSEDGLISTLEGSQYAGLEEEKFVSLMAECEKYPKTKKQEES